MSFKLALTAIVAFCLAFKISANVLELTKDTFHQHVDGSSNVLVEFYAPWCGHCKNLAPEYKLAAETFQAGDDIKLVAVDATESPELANKYGVQGYPTLKFFPKGSDVAEDYGGGRTADTIVKWINEKIGTSRKVKLPPSHVVALTTDSFDKTVLGSKAALVEFYAPWCGHCKNLAPKYEQLASAFAGESDVVIAKVDCTEEEDIASRYEISGYPTLKFFPPGSAEPENYEGQRELNAMVDFINSKVGTQRNADGTLKPSAGRVAVLDDLISSSSHKVDSVLVAGLKEKLEVLSNKDAYFGKLYLNTAEKILSKGSSYIQSETQRLSKLLSGSNLKPETRSTFMLRKNILDAFVVSENKEEL